MRDREIADLPPYDGSIPADEWRRKRQREIKLIQSRNSALLKLKDADGRPLYRMNENGNFLRTKPLSQGQRRRVVARDKCCVWCGAGAPFEVDHVIRYADGGSNEMENLQTLCEPCHRSKGGQ